MVSIKERVWIKSSVVEQDEQKVMNFFAKEKTVTLEIIVKQFPWFRWGNLFSILGRFRREGFVTVHQVGPLFELRLKNQPCDVV